MEKTILLAPDMVYMEAPGIPSRQYLPLPTERQYLLPLYQEVEGLVVQRKEVLVPIYPSEPPDGLLLAVAGAATWILAERQATLLTARFTPRIYRITARSCSDLRPADRG